MMWAILVTVVVVAVLSDSNFPTMRTLLLFLSLFILTGCKDTPPVNTPREAPVEALNASEYTTVLAPLIDPAKLDTLKGKRAATPRLRKACYWLQMAHTAGFDAGQIIDLSYDPDGPYGRLSYDQTVDAP